MNCFSKAQGLPSLHLARMELFFLSVELLSTDGAAGTQLITEPDFT